MGEQIEQKWNIPPGMHITEIPFGLPAGKSGIPGRFYIAMLVGGRHLCLSSIDETGRDDVRAWGSLSSARSVASDYVSRGAKLSAIVSLDINGNAALHSVSADPPVIGQYSDAGSW